MISTTWQWILCLIEAVWCTIYVHTLGKAWRADAISTAIELIDASVPIAVNECLVAHAIAGSAINAREWHVAC